MSPPQLPVALDEHTNYDPRQGMLRRADQCIHLRPKARALLEYLLDHPQQLLQRAQLMDAVWGHQHVSEHCLHQTISELRKALGNASWIRTEPNRGYRWCGSDNGNSQQYPLAALSDQRQPRNGLRRWPPAVALSTALLLMTSVIAWLGVALNPAAPAHAGIDARQLAAQPAAALHTLARGLDHYANGNYHNAIRFYQQSLQHDPDAAGIRLELARAQLALGELDAALHNTTLALSTARDQGDGYAEAASMNLLSRLEWLRGETQRSLLTLRDSAALAASFGHSCLVLESHQWQQYLLAWLSTPDQQTFTRIANIPEQTERCAAELDKLEQNQAS
ncbi:MAG: hypothetical protein Tsb002_28240 [Wenzhouxiangellaceae bacterium]